MKVFFIILISLFTSLFAQGQNVRIVPLAELESRIAGGKDTVYVVNFWATWCAPCIKELKHFDKLQSEFKEDKLKVLLVSVDFKSKLNSGVKPLVKRLNIQAEVLLLDEKSQQEYIDKVDPSWSGAIPATLIVHKSKGIRKFFETEFTYEELLNRYHSIK